MLLSRALYQHNRYTFMHTVRNAGLLLLASLASLSQAQPSGEARAPVPTISQGAPDAPSQDADATALQQTKEPRIIRGNDKVIATPPSAAALSGPASSFNFESAPIGEVVSAIMGDIVKTGYVVHPPLVGTVTLNAPGGVTPDQAVYLLEAALVANGLAMARDSRGIYHIGKYEVIRTIVPGVRQMGSGATLSPGTGAVIVPLQYIGAAEMASILKPLMPANALLRVDGVRNLLVLAGSRSQAEGWMDVVATFDIDLLKGMSVGVFPLKYLTTKEVEAALQLMNPSGASVAAASAAVPGAAGAARPAVDLAESANPLHGAVRVLPIERINSVLVVTPRAAYLEEARRWIDKLDQPNDGGAGVGLYVYPVKNGNAGHLSQVLGGIFGSAASTQGGGTGVAPGLAASTASSLGRGNAGMLNGQTGALAGVTGLSGLGGGGTNTSGRLGTAGLGGNLRQGSGQQAGQGTGALALGGQGGVRVVADEVNNALLIYGSRSDYDRIESALRKLDVRSAQVLIEASIIEVTLGDDLKYGLQWSFNDKERGGLFGAGTVGQLPANSTGGFSYTLTNSLGTVRATLSALAGKSLIKVISSPSLMVLDNQVATIAVGTQQPIRTGETTNLGTIGSPVTTTTYQYKDTGVQLSVQPSVSAGDLVTMDINQAVTDVGDEDVVTGQRAFLQRQISSKVAVRSGESLVLGGLIKDNETSGKSGVPVLQNLPIIGSLFGATTSNSGRTELLVVLTPRVVRSDEDARQAGEEIRDRMRNILRHNDGVWPASLQEPVRPQLLQSPRPELSLERP